jgi:hypothetical protein
MFSVSSWMLASWSIPISNTCQIVPWLRIDLQPALLNSFCFVVERMVMWWQHKTTRHGTAEWLTGTYWSLRASTDAYYWMVSLIRSWRPNVRQQAFLSGIPNQLWILRSAPGEPEPEIPNKGLSITFILDIYIVVVEHSRSKKSIFSSQ